MPLIIFLLLIGVIVWTLALARVKVPVHELQKFSLLHAVALGVVIVGSVFGYEFFHTSGGPIPITLDRMLLGGLLALAGWSWLKQRENLRQLNMMDITIIGVILFLGFSTFTNDYKFAKNLPLSRLCLLYTSPSPRDS